jgi:hypothetical protein
VPILILRVVRFTIAASILLLACIAYSQQAPSAASGCKAYLKIAPLDESVVKLLATPQLPPNPNAFNHPSFHQLVEWDLPSKVTPWRERPSADELARQWTEFDKKWTPAAKTPAPRDHARPYGWRTLSPEVSKDLEKWFAKEAPKKLPGTCVDSTQAGYVLVVGIVSGGTLASARPGASNPHEYEQLSAVRQQDAAVGPNAATYSPTAHESRPDELNGLGAGGDPSAHTCAFLYRAGASGGNGAAAGPAGTRSATPDYYYCYASGELPRSAVTNMLKYLAKTGLPE